MAALIASQAASFAIDLAWAGAQSAKLQAFRPDIRKYIGRKLELAMKLQGEQLIKVFADIEEVIDNDFQAIIGLTSDGLVMNAGGMFATFYDAMNGSTILLNAYTGIIQKEGINPIVERWIKSRVTPNIPDMQECMFLHTIGTISDADYKSLMEQNGWSNTLADVLQTIFYTSAPPQMIIDFMRRGYIDANWAKSMLKWHRLVGDTANFVTKLAESKPEPYRAAEFAAKMLIDDKDFKECFKWVGLSPQYADAWREAQYQYPNLGVITELYWRGLIDRKTWGDWLMRSGTRWDVVNTLFGLTESIPPSQDLVTMVVREAWEPANVTPAPDIFAGYMAKKGFSKDWSDRYWTAHWLPMGIQYGYANLHRGFWSKEQFDDLLRIADIHPRWRDAIYNVAFNPPSIREMGYGYDVGAYTKEDIIKYRRWGGLSEVDAAKAGLAMVAYRTEAEREAVRREYLNLYQLGKITDEEFTTELQAIGTAAEAVPLWLERGQLRRSALAFESSILEPKAMTRTDAQWLFEHGVYDETWLRGQLLNLGYEAETTESYILQSKQKLTEKVTPLETKKLTLAQIRDLYHYKLINEADVVVRVTELGYAEGDAIDISQIIVQEDIVAVIEKGVTEPRALTRSDVQWLFEHGLQNELWARDTLTAIGFESNAVDNYIAQSKQRMKEKIDVPIILPKPVKYNKLSKGELADLMYYRFMAPDEVNRRLVAYGWAADDAQLLIKLISFESAIADIKAIYGKGWLTQDQMKQALIGLGLAEELALFIMMKIVKYVGPERLAAERDLTKAEIVKGAKLEIITPSSAVSLLESIGYDAAEAWYILAINKVVAAGDPEGYWDMRKVTEAYKKARGEPSVDVPQELITLEREQRSVKAELEKAKAEKLADAKIGEIAVRLAGVNSRMFTITSKLGIK